MALPSCNRMIGEFLPVRVLSNESDSSQAADLAAACAMLFG